MPRYKKGNLEKNLRLVEALRQIGNEKGASPAQLAIAWVRSRGADIIPVIGARRREQLDERSAHSTSSSTPPISRESMPPCRRASPPADRYDAPQMAHLDSEAHA